MCRERCGGSKCGWCAKVWDHRMKWWNVRSEEDLTLFCKKKNKKKPRLLFVDTSIRNTEEYTFQSSWDYKIIDFSVLREKSDTQMHARMYYRVNHAKKKIKRRIGKIISSDDLTPPHIIHIYFRRISLCTWEKICFPKCGVFKHLS